MMRRVQTAIGSLRAAIVACGFVVICAAPAAAQNVTITLPATETFVVQNVQTSANGAQTTITWSTNGNFSQGKHFRISVKADVANFTPPSSGRSSIAATKVTWTVAAATNGTGSNGTLSSTAFTAVYDAGNGKKSGSVTLNWNLGAPGTNIRSGNHLLTVHWRLESI